ncbi:MAG: hypothetical protein RL172_577 [Bacteroidota bacterium]|jgi:GNAT superfamily N-acetyltransferase
MEVKTALTETAILKCRDAMLALRPHIAPAAFVPMVKEMIAEGYQLAYVEADGKAAAVIGYRYLQYLYNGKHIYIDDLSTLPEYRGKGYAGLLLDYVESEAIVKGYQAVTLDSGHHRAAAHRLYMNKGFTIVAHHFSKTLK